MSNRILVVDDSKIVTKMLSGLLSDAGYDVEAVNSPFAVSGSLKNFRPDLVIMDLNMPGLNGAKIIELVRKRDYDFDYGILVFSSENEDALRQAAGLEGVAGSIRKGVTNDELLRTVNKFMKTARLKDTQDKTRPSLDEKDPEALLRDITL